MKAKTLASIILAALSLLLCACSATAGGIVTVFTGSGHMSVEDAEAAAQERLMPSVSSSALKEEGTLTVGIKQDVQLPMAGTDSSGSLQGLDIDLASDVATKLGLKVRFERVDDAVSALAGDCDLVMDVEGGEADGVAMVGSYAETAYGVFGRNASGLATSDSMNGKRVAVQLGSAAQSALSKSGLQVQMAYASNINECFHMLEAGEADYAVCGAYQGAYLARTIEKISFCGNVGEIGTLGIGVSSSDTELISAVQDALDEAESDGTYDLIRARWLGGMGHLGAATEVAGTEASSSGDAAAAESQDAQAQAA